MSTFWIFAACLTLAYAIYYTVVICMDIYGKPKDQRQSTTETFSIDDIAPEASVAAIMVVISALQIYFKMQNGEGEISKSIQMLVGACLFMIGASIVFPAFFGYQI